MNSSYPKYKCHKEVSAAKIAAVYPGADGSLTVHLEGGFDKVVFSHEEMKRKHRPEIGWYLVVYSDGFRSFSPATAFEEGYTALHAADAPDGAGSQLQGGEASPNPGVTNDPADQAALGKAVNTALDGGDDGDDDDEEDAEGDEVDELAANATG